MPWTHSGLPIIIVVIIVPIIPIMVIVIPRIAIRVMPLPETKLASSGKSHGGWCKNAAPQFPEAELTGFSGRSQVPVVRSHRNSV